MIISIGYDTSIAVLEIEFKGNNTVWQYYDVPESIFNEFISSDSQGKYWHANIKGQYTENRVG